MSSLKFSQIIFCSIVTVSFTDSALLAQMIPDQTLGQENSTITPNTEIEDQLVDLIEGGARRDNNLFHSFREFNIGDSQSVFFANPQGIDNILTRVTGNNISEIFGTLGVDGTANLFLLNPNGIVFGENAALNFSGSFFATTADSYLFENDFAYSASNPDTPPLLTINLPVGIQFGEHANRIEINTDILPEVFVSDSFLDEFSESDLTPEELEELDFFPDEFSESDLTPEELEELDFFPDEFSESDLIPEELEELDFFPDEFSESDLIPESAPQPSQVTLIGGDLEFQNGGLSLPDGQITLGSVAPQSFVQILAGDDHWLIDYAAVNNFQNISLTDDAFITTSGDNPGIINIQTENLIVEGDSRIIADNYGIGQGKDITINATDTVEIGGENDYFSFISTDTYASGRGGNLNINTKTLKLKNNASLFSASYDAGDGGNLNIIADDSIIIEPFAYVASTALGSGNGGKMNIHAGSLTVANATIDASTLGGGNGGDIELNVKHLTLSDTGTIDNITIGEGDAGNTIIQADVVELLNGGSIANDALDKGNGGEIKITASSLILKGRSEIFPSDGLGDDFSLPSIISSDSVQEQGNAGRIELNVNNIKLLDGALITTTAAKGSGNGGDILINSDSIELDGELELFGDDFFLSGGILSQAQFFSSGNAGNIHLNTKQLTIANSAQISSTTAGEGNSGDIEINADSIEIIGVDSASGIASGIFASAEENSSGSGGNVNITATQDFRLVDGGSLQANSLGTGNAGDIKINAPQLQVAGAVDSTTAPEYYPSNISAFSALSADAGSININSNYTTVSDRGNISVSNSGTGNSGNLNITTSMLNLNDSAVIEATVNAGNQGNINLTTDNIFLNHQSEITVLASGTATGGNININNLDNLVLNHNSRIIADAIAGDGGNVDIATQGYFISADSLVSASSELGLDGNVEVETINGDRPITLEQLPENPIDATQEIHTSCGAGQQQFAIAGKGGLPENPLQSLRGQSVWQDLRLITLNAVEAKSKSLPPTSIQEAQSWQINRQGKIELVANNYSFFPVNNFPTCQ